MGFCAVGCALRSCPATKAVLCVGRFLRGCPADKYVGRLSLWSALFPPPPPLLMLFLFLPVILLSFDPLMYKDWFHTSVLRVLGMGVGWGGSPWDNQQFGRATFGVRFCAVGRALRSCPATKAVLCVGRFLRGCFADVCWLVVSVVCPPPSLCSCFFSAFQSSFCPPCQVYHPPPPPPHPLLIMGLFWETGRGASVLTPLLF